MSEGEKHFVSRKSGENFLQSDMWRAFQEAAGHETLGIETEIFCGNGIIHHLPLVGKYLYFPRGPVLGFENTESGRESIVTSLKAAGEGVNAKWIRIEPSTEEELERYREYFGKKLRKAPHDMQPRETLVMNIEPSEDALLAGMKSKTRYNIRLAEKKNLRIFSTREKKYQEQFLDLMTKTADRKGIVPHPRAYYEKFFSSLPEGNLFLFVAEYEKEVLAANLVLLYGDTATYLHGGTSAEYRESMAAYLLQWGQIRFAKSKGMKLYDFGGVKTGDQESSWAGITRFKQGFTPSTATTIFPGSYDIVLDPVRYFLYRKMSILSGMIVSLKKSF